MLTDHASEVTGGDALASIDRACGTAADSGDAVRTRLAGSPEELEQAYRLLHDEYVRAHIQTPLASGIRLLPHYALPVTHTVVAKRGAGVIGTASLVLPSRRGLPMQEDFAESIAALIAAGRRPAEISGLAVRGLDQVTALLLFRTLYAYALALGITDLVLTVSPNHAPFYLHTLKFEHLGLGTCRHVINAPAVALRCDLSLALTRFPDDTGIIGRHLTSWLTTMEAERPRLSPLLERELADGMAVRRRFLADLIGRREGTSDTFIGFPAADREVILDTFDRAANGSWLTG